ncbi:hypothetical protein FTUN_6113 [Frigoriglobus tundricola]|uniref:Uncharacterized protein n=1 Tax=Frigoriglobus tundricola TaxID=2774151 RepID=A0A6M5YZ72_9BACT|nr:hypothetical protein FTUN_6113 [Frigoriglobus tundricola]
MDSLRRRVLKCNEGQMFPFRSGNHSETMTRTHEVAERGTQR